MNPSKTFGPPEVAPTLGGGQVQDGSFAEKEILVDQIMNLYPWQLAGVVDIIRKFQPELFGGQNLLNGVEFDVGLMNSTTLAQLKDYVARNQPRLGRTSNQGFPAPELGLRPIAGAPGVFANIHGVMPSPSVGLHSSANIPDRSIATHIKRESSHLRSDSSHPSSGKSKSKKTRPNARHKCDVCGKMFRGRSELVSHIRTHTGEKPLICSYSGCNKRYAHSSNLRAHERTHKNIKPYKCPKPGCTKAFAHSVSLKEHVWMHDGKKPYACEYPGCGRRFTQISNYARHKKLHRKNEHRGV